METQPAMLFESLPEHVGLLLRKFAVFLGPIGEEPAQLLDAISLSVFRWEGFDAHRLAFPQRRLRIENDHTVFHVSKIRRLQG